MPFGLGFFAVAGASAAPASYDLLESVILTGSASSITFSSLSTYVADYKHLQLRAVMRNTANAGTGGLSVRFNGDSGSNYTYHLIEANGSSVGSGAGTSQAQLALGWVPHGSVTPAGFSATVIDILDAFNTSKYKTARSYSGSYVYSAIMGMWSGAWLNTAALTSISCVADGGNSYASGCRVSLYGIKG